MAKVTNYIAVIFSLSCLICHKPVSSNGNIRDNVVDTLKSYLFVKEATGHNDGYWVEKFIESTGLDPKGQYAWCAALQCYVFKANGLKVPKYPARAAAWFDEGHIIPDEDAMEGDLGSFYYTRLKRIGHIGMYLKPYKNTTPYVEMGEGNTNDRESREGNRAAKNLRLRATIYNSSNWIDEKH